MINIQFDPRFKIGNERKVRLIDGNFYSGKVYSFIPNLRISLKNGLCY